MYWSMFCLDCSRSFSFVLIPVEHSVFLCQYETVVDDCTAALELDPSYVKALLRRAQANEHLEKYDMALEGANT